MKKAEFLLEVMAELDNIKAKATKEEIGKLNIINFNPNSPYRCIYGQMTGSCVSERAKDLTPKTYSFIGGKSFHKQNMVKDESFKSFTPLEKYLFMVKEPTHKKIINYLKNKTNVIKLK